MMWTLKAGLAFARQVESWVSPSYHIAVGGSVLTAGQSDKDLDLFIYPHSTEHCPRRDVMAKLENIGVEWVETKDHFIYGDDKIVEEASYQGKRVDFFFVL